MRKTEVTMHKLIATALGLLVASALTTANAQAVVESQERVASPSGFVLTANAGYGVNTLQIESSQAQLNIYTPAPMLRISAGYRFNRLASISYNFQSLTDGTGMIHTHSLGWAVIPDRHGFTTRIGAGLFAISPFEEGEAVFGVALDAGLGYQFALGAKWRITIDMPFGLAIPTDQPEDASVVDYTLGLQAGFTFMG